MSKLSLEQDYRPSPLPFVYFRGQEKREKEERLKDGNREKMREGKGKRKKRINIEIKITTIKRKGKMMYSIR